MVHDVLGNIFRRQPILQQTDDPARLFLPLEYVATTPAQQSVEKSHGPAPADSSESSVLPTSTATRHTPSVAFRQMVT